MMTLYQLEDFERYLKFNGITDETIRFAAGFMKVESYKKGEYIFRQGDPANKFYGIIKGVISIRAIRGNKVIRNQSRDLLEEERTRMNPGMCFGEWALIYKITRTASAYCLEDVDLFYLERDVFESTLSKAIVKAELEKKKFVTQKIPLLSNCGRISDILSAINPLFFDKNQIVYSEFDPADSLYVIYQGECCLTKGSLFKSKAELEYNKETLIPVYNFDKGAILGLETVHQSGNNYSNTLMASQNYTVVYQLKYSRLNFLSSDIHNFISPLQKIHESLIQKAINNFQLKKLSITRIENRSIIHQMLDSVINSTKQVDSNNAINTKKYFQKIQTTPRTITVDKGDKVNTSYNKPYINFANDQIVIPNISMKQKQYLRKKIKGKEANLTCSNLTIKNELFKLNIDSNAIGTTTAYTYNKNNKKESILRPKRKSMCDIEDKIIYCYTLRNLRFIDKNKQTLSYYNSGTYNLPLLSCCNLSSSFQMKLKKLKNHTDNIKN